MLVFEVGRKTRVPVAKTPIKNYMTPAPQIEPGQQWWEASTLTATQSLLPSMEVSMATLLAS